LNGFLVDENIPSRLMIAPALPVIHSRSLGISPSDTALWLYAREHSLAIVTKDADFSNRIMVSDPPPWIVRLRFGNMRRVEFHALLAKMWPHIESLLPTHKLISVYTDRIEFIKI
jgi:predicted nuclease of predicted toxin-antitoxin system